MVIVVANNVCTNPMMLDEKPLMSENCASAPEDINGRAIPTLKNIPVINNTSINGTLIIPCKAANAMAKNSIRLNPSKLCFTIQSFLLNLAVSNAPAHPPIAGIKKNKPKCCGVIWKWFINISGDNETQAKIAADKHPSPKV